MQDFYFIYLFFNKAWIISDSIMHSQSFLNPYFVDYTENYTERFKTDIEIPVNYISWHYLINKQKTKPGDL